MEHSYIEERRVIDRYLMKQLPHDEEIRFEDHYVHCQECLDRLELAEKLQRGFKRAAAGDAAKVAAAQRLGILARLAALARSPRAGLAAMALLAVALLPAGLLVRELDRTRAALAARAGAAGMGCGRHGRHGRRGRHGHGWEQLLRGLAGDAGTTGTKHSPSCRQGERRSRNVWGNECMIHND